jgi:hypothetical protein
LYALEPDGSATPVNLPWLKCYRLLPVSNGDTYLECVVCGCIRPGLPIKHAVDHGYPRC